MQCTLNTRRKLGGGILLALTRIRCLVVVESATDQQLPGASLANMVIRCGQQMRQKFGQWLGFDKQAGCRCHLNRGAHTLQQRRRAITACQNDLIGGARAVICHHSIDAILINHQAVYMPLFRLYRASSE